MSICKVFGEYAQLAVIPVELVSLLPSNHSMYLFLLTVVVATLLWHVPLVDCEYINSILSFILNLSLEQEQKCQTFVSIQHLCWKRRLRSFQWASNVIIKQKLYMYHKKIYNPPSSVKYIYSYLRICVTCKVWCIWSRQLPVGLM